MTGRGKGHRFLLADAEIKIERLEQDKAELLEVLGELVEVANLRGDNILPHPADDPTLWTARMQTAWDEAEAIIREQDETSC